MKTLRPFVLADAPLLAAFLRAEGLAPHEMAFDTLPTFVLEEGGVVMGFVTLGVAHDVFPQVVHMVIARAHRNAARARFLMRATCALARAAGSRRLILHACQPYVRRLIEWYFRAMPYALTDERAYYVVTA